MIEFKMGVEMEYAITRKADSSATMNTGCTTKAIQQRQYNKGSTTKEPSSAFTKP